MINWTLLLNEIIDDLTKRKKTYRAVGSDGEELKLYLHRDSPHLMKLKEDLKLQKYKPRPLLVKLLPKNPDEPPRKVFVPTNRDYLVARAINLNLTRSTAVSSLSAKKLLRNIINNISGDQNRFRAVARLDLRDFFGSIPYEKSIRLMSTDPRIDKDIIYYLELFAEEASLATAKKGSKLTSGPEVAPQGLPYSPAVANWYVEEIFNKSSEGIRHLTTYRYLDDMLVLFEGSKPSWKIHLEIHQLKSLLKRNGLYVHPFNKMESKSQIVRTFDLEREFIFLGLSLNLSEDGKIDYYIPDKVIKFEKTKIWQLFHRYLRPNEQSSLKKVPLDDRIAYLHYRLILKSEGCRYQGKTYGFLNYWSYSDDASSFKLLDVFIKKLEKEFFPILKESSFYSQSPKLGSSYFDTFQKIRSSNYHEHFELNFDKMTRKDRIQFLKTHFQVPASALHTMKDQELDAYWHHRVRGEII